MEDGVAEFGQFSLLEKEEKHSETSEYSCTTESEEWQGAGGSALNRKIKMRLKLNE